MYADANGGSSVAANANEVRSSIFSWCFESMAAEAAREHNGRLCGPDAIELLWLKLNRFSRLGRASSF